MPIDVSTQEARRQLDATLRALGDVCTCRLRADCWALMRQLAVQGALPPLALQMTDEEWALGCGVPAPIVKAVP